MREVIRSEPHGKGADWWALGVLLHQMLAGNTPFDSPSFPATQRKILHAAPLPPLLEGVPADAASLVGARARLPCRPATPRAGSPPPPPATPSTRAPSPPLPPSTQHALAAAAARAASLPLRLRARRPSRPPQVRS